MRTNRLRELIEADDRPLWGAFPTSPTPRLVEMLGHLGFDWVMLDAEHDALSLEQAYSLVLAADAHGMASVIRAPVNRPEVVLGYAETGVDSIIAPHVTTAAGARDLVASLAYPPAGTRGLAAGSRAANFGITQPGPEYFANTAAHTLPAALLEDVEAYDNLDEILAVEGLDILCLGAGDLSGSMGLPGQGSHPDVQARVTDAARRIQEAGKIASAGAGDAASARAAAQMGARLIQVSLNNLMFGGVRDFFAAVR